MLARRPVAAYIATMTAQPASSYPDAVAITCTPGVMGGAPCVAGTRVPVETILACIDAGESVFDIYRGYPYLPAGAVDAVVEWALAHGRAVKLPVRRVPDA